MWYWNDSDGLDGLVQERRNSSALAMELRLFCTDASVCLMQVEACYADMYKYDPMELAIKRNNKEAIKLLGKELFLNTKERVQPPESYVTRQDTGRSDSELNLPRLSLYSLLSLSFLLTSLWLVSYCSLWLYFSPGN